MRGVPMSKVLEELTKKNFKIDAANVEYDGGTLADYLESKRKEEVMSLSMEPENVSEIKDDETAYSYTWSSKKISDEITKQRRRLDNLVAVDEETISDKELVDIRTDVDGNHHDTAGNAVRYQVENLGKKLEETATKKDLININRFESTNVRLSNDGIVGKKYTVNGTDTNIIKVPNIDNYIIFTAVNNNYEENNFFVMGVSHGNEESYVFVNRVIPETETLNLHVFYVKIS